MEKEPIKSHEDLEVYKMAFDVAMKVFELSKKFPIEERYSLTFVDHHALFVLSNPPAPCSLLLAPLLPAPLPYDFRRKRPRI